MTEPGLAADYFDGRSARPRRVRLQLRAGRLLILDDTPSSASAVVIDQGTPLRSAALDEVRWPERTRHGARIAHLAGGGELHALASADWDAFVAGAGLREGFVVRSQQSWRAVLAVSVLLLALVAAGWRWGVPLLADATLAVLPASVDAQVGEIALQQVEARWLAPSKLPPAQQAALRSAFDQAVRSAAAEEQPAPYRLEFRAADIGPNAFALPGGTIVMTDELVQLVEGDEAALVGVLAHEYGHVRGRHGMRQLVQATLLGAAGSLAFGDFSGLLAAAPALLGTLGYSRQLEREADGEAITLLRAAGRDPAAMVGFFERLARWRAARGETADDSVLGIAFSSHPADAERIERFRAAARQ
ncbi:MAG: M48 family metallopeptidase [Methylibium sp.]|uniref:M48 family metallopeptidase n=1 Tax=Methylibium sp. TaxID=2067992 RepID=UPI001794247A|nr:M48 family metallopeptidase [Methylibium sp.]MBA3599458.1 M48 family metallopeptidase [Methylibium sp.]